jgi:hypothetical protein
LDSSHNASAKIQKRFNTKTIFLSFSTIIQEKEEKKKVAFSYFLLKVPAIFTEGWTKKLIKIKQ